jgi:hypothetical protein
MYADILIPSYKPIAEGMEMIKQIENTRTTRGMVFYSAHKGSAAENRNQCLDVAKETIVIMLDDDIEGFYKGWDEDLIKPLIEDTLVIGVSARLMNLDGTPAYTMVENYDLETPLIFSPKMQTACCAFRNTDLRFDENFIGSGFEDDDYCRQLLRKYGPDKLFATVNACKIIHRNEAKNQGGAYWEHNQKHFNRKWGIEDCEYKMAGNRCRWNIDRSMHPNVYSCCEQNCHHGRFK